MAEGILSAAIFTTTLPVGEYLIHPQGRFRKPNGEWVNVLVRPITRENGETILSFELPVEMIDRKGVHFEVDTTTFFDGTANMPEPNKTESIADANPASA